MKTEVNKNEEKKIKREIKKWNKHGIPLSKSNERVLKEKILYYYPNIQLVEDAIPCEYVDEYQIKNQNFEVFREGEKVDSIPIDEIVSWFIEKHPLFRLEFYKFR